MLVPAVAADLRAGQSQKAGAALHQPPADRALRPVDSRRGIRRIEAVTSGAAVPESRPPNDKGTFRHSTNLSIGVRECENEVRQ
jgi:hypothetical protein